ncbi:MAG: F0F1 ATP synthase subunit A [Candidatus Margulisiibacteriota bacterium]
MEILEHFVPEKIVPLNLSGIDLSITNAVISLWIGIAIALLLVFLACRRAKMVPGLIQNAIEAILQFIQNEMLGGLPPTLQAQWTPFIFTIFFLILTLNYLGLVPGTFAVTSNINFTATLAIIVFLTCLFASFKTKGFFGYFKALVPPGVPAFVVPIIFPVEIVSQLARPFSLAVRLFANLFAGHTIILVFLSLILMLKSYLSVLPLMGNVLICGFELFLGLIQAFIFTYLSAMYITEAVSLEH